MRKGISDQGIKRLAQLAEESHSLPAAEFEEAVDNAAVLVTKAFEALWPYKDGNGEVDPERMQGLIESLDGLAMELYKLRYEGSRSLVR